MIQGRTRAETKRLCFCSLQEITEFIATGMPVDLNAVREKFGVSSAFFNFLKESGYITPIEKKKRGAQLYSTKLLTPIAELEFEGIYSSYQRWRVSQKKNVTSLTSVKKDKSETILTLIDSLKKLGAHGKVWITQEYEF
jgi:hypothetical protein